MKRRRYTRRKNSYELIFYCFLFFLALFVFKTITLIILQAPIILLLIIVALIYALTHKKGLRSSHTVNISYAFLSKQWFMEFLSHFHQLDKYLNNEEISKMLTVFLDQQTNQLLPIDSLSDTPNFSKLCNYLGTTYHLPALVIKLLIIRQQRFLAFNHYKNFILSDKINLTLDHLLYYTAVYNKVHHKDLNLSFVKQICTENQLTYPDSNLFSNKLSDYYLQAVKKLDYQELRHSLITSHSALSSTLLISEYFHHVTTNISFDDDTEHYFISGKDYVRGNKIDSYYMKSFHTVLEQAFNGCVHCNSIKMGVTSLEYDHFWLPKSKGGNFAMRHKNGYYINNCVPLCGNCNKQKSAKSIYDFYSIDELTHIIEVNQSLTPKLNEIMSKYYDEQFPNRKI